tara:strand:+ start:5058 stop:5768 length:711 start_codon:yes stop_codon:yes gene_type:complete
MTIKKANVQEKYTVITNKAAQNPSLSLEARGLLLMMSSKPNDWIFHKTQIMSECSIGKDKLSRVFKELESQGHLCITQSFDEQGRFKSNDYFLFTDSDDNPAFLPLTDLPLTDLPLTDKPLTVNPPLQKKDLLLKKDITNICQQIADAYNAKFPELANVMKVTPKRKSHVNALVKDFGKSHNLGDIKEWGGLFDYIAESDFLMGRSSSWRCDFDFIINKNNMLKILEGKYENDTGT